MGFQRTPIDWVKEKMQVEQSFAPISLWLLPFFLLLKWLMIPTRQKELELTLEWWWRWSNRMRVVDKTSCWWNNIAAYSNICKRNGVTKRINRKMYLIAHGGFHSESTYVQLTKLIDVHEKKIESPHQEPDIDDWCNHFEGLIHLNLHR